ncbi:MAG: hypothetical protein ACLFNW_10595 [Desulfobacterales bacterium]
MKKSKLMAIAGFVLVMAAGVPVMAHTPLCSCYEIGGGAVICEGGFSDGSSAAGVGIRVEDKDGNELKNGKMDDFSEFEFQKPDVPYTVIFDAGPGHEVKIKGEDIQE